MKINLITMHKVTNYGSVLQTYATSKYLSELGHEVKVINYIPERFRTKYVFSFVNPRRDKSVFHRIAFRIACFPGRLMHNVIFNNFINRSYKLTEKTYYNIEDLKNNIPEADIYITGSDQVWNTNFEKKIDDAFFLDFVPSGKKRLSYAASFGKASLNEDEKDRIKELLMKYDSISVREDAGVKIINELGIEKCEHVVDPTLLLSKEQWNEKASERLTNKKYVLIYQLNPSNKLIEYAKQIAEKNGVKVAKFGWDYIKPKGVDINFSYKKPEDFLSAIKYAEFVVTDSFHGTIFSLKFNKNFICIAPPKYSSRLESILRETKLEDRLIKEGFDLDIALEEIDYGYIESHMSKKIIKSKEYLKMAIG